MNGRFRLGLVGFSQGEVHALVTEYLTCVCSAPEQD